MREGEREKESIIYRKKLDRGKAIYIVSISIHLLKLVYNLKNIRLSFLPPTSHTN